jgi:hypothetical protein
VLGLEISGLSGFTDGGGIETGSHAHCYRPATIVSLHFAFTSPWLALHLQYGSGRHACRNLKRLFCAPLAGELAGRLQHGGHYRVTIIAAALVRVHRHQRRLPVCTGGKHLRHCQESILWRGIGEGHNVLAGALARTVPRAEALLGMPGARSLQVKGTLQAHATSLQRRRYRLDRLFP